MTQPPEDRVDHSLRALRRILRAAELFARDLARGAGLTPAQLRVLQLAGAIGGGVTPSVLAARMGVRQATVTALVDRLAARGMVTRVRSETDRRQTNVVPTETGRAAAAEVPDALQQRYVRAFRDLEDWEQAQLVSSLERVAAMMDPGGFDASPVLTHGDIGADKAGG